MKKRTWKTTENNLLYRLLTIVIYRTQNDKKVEKSRFMYGKNSTGYFLRPVGILHGLFGLVVVVPIVTKKWEDI